MEYNLEIDTLFLKTFNPYVVHRTGGCSCENKCGCELQATFIHVAEVADTDTDPFTVTGCHCE